MLLRALASVPLLISLACQSTPANSTSTEAGLCGGPIRGLAPLINSGAMLLFGEFHGTNEAPRFVTDVACRAALAGHRVQLGLEISISQQQAIDEFMISEAPHEQRKHLLDGHFDVEFFDGRESVAMLELFERIRQLRREHLKIEVFGFSWGKGQSPSLPGDQDMFENVDARYRSAQPSDIFIILGGGAHTRRHEDSLGGALARAGYSLISLGLTHAGGTFWGCSGGCGEHRTSGKDEGQQRFIALRPTFAGKYDGVYYPGRVSASPPAVSPKPSALH